MSFTDLDVKRYKELAEKCHPLNCELTLALLTRLDAAERLIKACGEDLNVSKQYEAWLRSKGGAGE